MWSGVIEGDVYKKWLYQCVRCFPFYPVNALIYTRNQPAGLVGRRSARFWTPTERGKLLRSTIYPRWWLSNGTNPWSGAVCPGKDVHRWEGCPGSTPGLTCGINSAPSVLQAQRNPDPSSARPGSIQTPKQHRSLIFIYNYIYESSREAEARNPLNRDKSDYKKSPFSFFFNTL